jgi:Tol biopolymer transport system component
VRVRLLCVVVAGAALHGVATIEWTAMQQHAASRTLASASVSADGRTVAFESLAQLDPRDTNSYSDIYALEIPSGRIELVSIGPDSGALWGSSMTPSVSGDGRYVVFESVTPASQAACMTLFLRDRQAGATRALTKAVRGPSQFVCARRPSISRDGAWVAFDSDGRDLMDGEDVNGLQADVYVMNLLTGQVGRASVRTDGTQPPDGSSFSASLSASGESVAFTSTACLDGVQRDRAIDEMPAGTCLQRVYVRDLVAGRTRGLWAPGGAWPTAASYGPVLSGNGRYVAFVSTATNLVREDTGRRPNVYVYDLQTDAFELVSRTRRGGAGDGPSGRPAISETGRFVAFDSTASDLLCARSCGARERDHNLVADVFVLDRELKVMRRASEEQTGQQWWVPSVGPALDAASGVVTFSSRHPTDPGDTRADFDLFVRRLSQQ